MKSADIPCTKQTSAWRCRAVAIVCCWLSLTASAFGSEIGAPFVTNYSHRDYGAHPQNWAATQDSRGVMYFGNPDGVLEFDGAEWRTFPVANQSIVRSLAVDAQDTLYVGAVGEFGFLRPDSNGDLIYVSLVKELPVEHRSFADVWRTHVTAQGIFFFARERIFRWHRDRFQVFELDCRFGPYLVDGRLYVNDYARGLQVFAGEAFEPVAGGESLAEKRVSVLLSADAEKLLIGDYFGHLFELSPAAPEAERLVPLATDVDDELSRHKLYTGARLPDGSYVFGTVSGGAFVVGPDGNLRYRIDRSTGLPDASVWTAFVDRQGGLWLGLNRGLSRIRVNSPITVFDERSGLGGTVEAVGRHRKTLYTSTSVGLARWVDGRFAPISDIPAPCWTLLSFAPPEGEPRLLVGAVNGLYELHGDQARRIHEAENAFSVFRSVRDPEAFFVGEVRGLRSLRFSSGRWLDLGLIEGIDHEVRSIAEDASGRLWIGTHYDGLFRLTLDSDPEPRVKELVHYGAEQGLPSAKSVKVLMLGDQVLLATEKGLYRFDPARERIVPSELLGDAWSHGNASINRLVSDPAGNLWLGRDGPESPALATRQADGTFQVDDTPFRRLPPGVWYALFPEPDGVTWLGGTEGLYRFDAALATPNDPAFSTLIRRVTLGDGRTLYRGDALAQELDIAPLDYQDNNLIFQFSAPSFDDPSTHRFSYQLEGNDPDGSPWSPATRKEYTNLHEGDYQFKVRGKNIYGTTGEVASFRFSIRPPWYRSVGAYALYFCLAVGFAQGLAQLRSRRLARERDQLKSRVAETVSQIKILKGLLPICASCKRIRDDEDHWSDLEVFIDSHSEAHFSHGICPDCIEDYRGLST